MTFIVVPHGGGDLSTRSFEISYRRLRFFTALMGLAALVWVGTLASWWYVAAQAARVPLLKREIAVLEQKQDSVRLLAQRMTEMEDLYRKLRVMLGADRGQDSLGLWVPPPEGGADDEPADSLHSALPTSWPLSRVGFVTREHLGRIPGQHPGIDIAIAEGTYVRAAGPGRVVEAGEDPVYGRYVRIHHQDGYESLYGHASQLFVEARDTVERHEVIALSGNTGTSTAPHLHFEILKDGEPIDPRALVQPPS